MRTVLICHEQAGLDREVLAPWLCSFSQLAGLVILRERPQRLWRRIRREIKRVGWARFADVLAFRIYYRLFIGQADRLWEQASVESFSKRFAPIPRDVPVLYTHSPNAPEAEAFIRDAQPDMMIARCKAILKESVFSIPRKGTFVMHPGVCPEYRNAHGCFWALAQKDYSKVGMTLLRVDRGVDTGPVYGYYSYSYDPKKESHVVIQQRVVLENLDSLRRKLLEVYESSAEPISIDGRKSGEWGQPWLSAYLRIKRASAKA